MMPEGDSPLMLPANQHKQLVVIDFEYANANLPGLEFANHFVSIPISTLSRLITAAIIITWTCGDTNRCRLNGHTTITTPKQLGNVTKSTIQRWKNNSASSEPT